MEDTLRISGIIDESIVDGKGLRYTIFTQGCPHHCEGCHNPDTHDFEGGTEKEITAIYEEICSNPLLSGVTFSGGEPFCQPAPLAVLAEMVHKKGLNVTTYTGYTLEQLLEMKRTSKQKTEIRLNLNSIQSSITFIKSLCNSLRAGNRPF